MTPSSKVVGDLALFMVTNDLTADDVLNARGAAALSASVVEMMQGLLGEPEGGWPKRVSGDRPAVGARASRSRAGRARRCRRPTSTAAAREIQAKTEREPREEDVLSYLLYPQVFLDFDEHRQQYGDTSTIPTPNFFYGLQPGEEIAVEIERGKTLIVRYLTTGEVREDGTRTVFFELNGQPREVRVADRSVEATAEAASEGATRTTRTTSPRRCPARSRRSP